LRFRSRAQRKTLHVRSKRQQKRR